MKKAVVIVLTLALLGVGGWTVYAQKNNTNLKANTPQPSNETGTLQGNSSKDNKYLVIKEWGARMELSKSIRDAKYRYKNDSVVYLSTDKVEDVEGCEAGNAMSLQRAKKGEPIGASSVNELLANNPSVLKQVGEFYFLFVASPRNCAHSDDSTGGQLLETVRRAFTEAQKKVEVIPN